MSPGVSYSQTHTQNIILCRVANGKFKLVKQTLAYLSSYLVYSHARVRACGEVS